MKRHKINVAGETSRERVERRLITKYPNCIKVFEPLTDHVVVDRFKDGTYGLSSAGFALYSNGHNLRGKSSFAPFGLLYHDSNALFGIGYFHRQEYQEEKGSVMIVAPAGKAVYEAIRSFTEMVLADDDVAAVYVRFLSNTQKSNLLGQGFRPIEARSWHTEAEEEDETFSHSLLEISKVLRIEGNDFSVIDLEKARDKDHRVKSRLAFQRFENFLKRNNLPLTMRKMQAKDEEIARQMITNHFASLRRAVGSTSEDYLEVVNMKIILLPQVYAYIGHLKDKPISVFIGEELGNGIVGIYTSITLRNITEVLSKLGLDPNETIDNLPELVQEGAPEKVARKHGGSAISLFNQLNYLAKLAAQGIKFVKLGGSETIDLDQQKRQLGAVEDKTHWVVRFK